MTVIGVSGFGGLRNTLVTAPVVLVALDLEP